MIVMKTTQGKILSVLQSVAGIVERRHTLPILANVLIRKTGSSVKAEMGYNERGELLIQLNQGGNIAFYRIRVENNKGSADFPGGHTLSQE